MKFGKHFLVIMCITISLCLLTTACGGAQGTAGTQAAAATTAVSQASAAATTAVEKADPFGKMKDPVEITSCRILTTWMGFDEGENENNNWWSRTYQDQLNVKLNVVWTAPNWGPDYDQKIDTSLATNDLPDIVPVYTSLAMKIAKAGMIADIKDAYEKYASPYLKDCMQFRDGLLLKQSTYDGKMFAIADNGNFGPQGTLAWIRADWLQKTGLPVPKTLDELIAVAAKFKEMNLGGKSTIPIAADKDLQQLEYIMAMYGAYAKGWVDKNGSLEFALIQPEMEKSLEKLSELYKQGLIAKDFATKDLNNEGTADIASGKVGIVLDETHFPAGGPANSFKKNFPDVDWVYAPIQAMDGSVTKRQTSSAVQNFTVVTNKCKNPEAVIKLCNLKSQIFSNQQPAFINDTQYDNTKGGNMSFWNAVVQSPQKLDDQWNQVQKARQLLKDGGDPSSLSVAEKRWYDPLKLWKDEGTKNKEFANNWGLDKLDNFGGSMEWVWANKDQCMYWDPYWGTDTDSMVKYGTEWATKYKEFFIKGIMTGNVQQEFNNWIAYFKANGGDDATREVNDWYAKNK